MVGVGVRKNTKTIITPGLGNTESERRQQETVFMSFLNYEAVGDAQSSPNACHRPFQKWVMSCGSIFFVVFFFLVFRLRIKLHEVCFLVNFVPFIRMQMH